MKIINKGKSLIVIGGVLFVVIISVAFILVRIGGAYKSGLNKFSMDEEISDVTHTERQKIRKIIIKNTTDTGCMEVMPDGIIRVFTVCQKELSDARRMTDTKFILRLYKKMGETDLTKLPDASRSVCGGYLMTLETDTETKTVCLANTSNDNNPSGGNISGSEPGVNDDWDTSLIDEIITIIDQVIDNIPPTPTLTSVPVAPTSMPGTSITITPTSLVFPSWGVTPTPVAVRQMPFSCDFTDFQGKKRPYTISNIICSSEPSPGPTIVP